MDDQFWHMHGPNAPPQAEWDRGKVKCETVKCPGHLTGQRGGKRLTDLSVVLSDGPLEDFVWTWYSECLVQDYTLDILRENGVTGFDVKPVKARYEKSSEKPPRLWEICMTGWGGMARPSSGIQLDKAKSCGICGFLAYTALVHPEQLIDEKKWDGSDLFIVWPMPRFIMCSSRVMQIIIDHRLAGVRFTPTHELKVENYNFSPGRLSYWMPEKRARELGEPLGIY